MSHRVRRFPTLQASQRSNPLVIAASDCTMLLVFLRANIASPCVDLVSPLNCSNSCLCLPVWVLTSSRNVRMN